MEAGTAKSPDFSVSQASSSDGQKGGSPQQPQVDDSIGQEIDGSGWSAGYTLLTTRLT
jgi:hypothetical protein